MIAKRIAQRLAQTDVKSRFKAYLEAHQVPAVSVRPFRGGYRAYLWKAHNGATEIECDQEGNMRWHKYSDTNTASRNFRVVHEERLPESREAQRKGKRKAGCTKAQDLKKGDTVDGLKIKSVERTSEQSVLVTFSNGDESVYDADEEVETGKRKAQSEEGPPDPSELKTPAPSCRHDWAELARYGDGRALYLCSHCGGHQIFRR